MESLNLQLLFTQIHPTKLKENSFWAKAHEERLENAILLQQISENFASKPGKKVLPGGDGENKEKKKGKELKVLDPKAAQNLCKYTIRRSALRVVTMFEGKFIHCCVAEQFKATWRSESKISKV